MRGDTLGPGVEICCWIIFHFKGHVGRRIIVLVNYSVCVGVLGGLADCLILTPPAPHTMQASKSIGDNDETYIDVEACPGLCGTFEEHPAPDVSPHSPAPSNP